MELIAWDFTSHWYVEWTLFIINVNKILASKGIVTESSNKENPQNPLKNSGKRENSTQECYWVDMIGADLTLA